VIAIGLQNRELTMVMNLRHPLWWGDGDCDLEIAIGMPLCSSPA
jgi:hypothetical protein